MSFRRHGSGHGSSSSNWYEQKFPRGRSGSACGQMGVASKDEDMCKLVMIGDSGVGKSCLLEKLIDRGSNNSFISTIGVDIRSHNVSVDGKAIKLQVWDTGGQERYRSFLTTCYKNAHGIIIVFDVTNPNSFANLNQWMSEVKEFAKADLPKLLIANKCDLLQRRKVDHEAGSQFAEANGMAYIETSAVKTENITEAFVTLIKQPKAKSLLSSSS